MAIKCGLESANDSLELGFMHVQPALGPDHVVRQRHLLFRRPLGREALVDLFIGPAARAQALALRLRGTRHADDGVDLRSIY